MGRNSRLLLSALLTIAGAILPQRGRGRRIVYGDDTCALFTIGSFACGGDSHGHSHSGRCTGSQRHCHLLQCCCNLL